MALAVMLITPSDQLRDALVVGLEMHGDDVSIEDTVEDACHSLRTGRYAADAIVLVTGRNDSYRRAVAALRQAAGRPVPMIALILLSRQDESGQDAAPPPGVVVLQQFFDYQDLLNALERLTAR
ncbi:MAG: hypothetical protein HY332_22605 [Chloroflexi bacterium]|nr:hypothetical protein [Chloroflexota bacterium]